MKHHAKPTIPIPKVQVFLLGKHRKLERKSKSLKNKKLLPFALVALNLKKD